MNRRIVTASAVGLIVIATTAVGAYWFGTRVGTRVGAHPAETSSPGHTATAAETIKTGRKILYWHDPMVPGQKFDKPGKSPFMDMELVPVYADGQQAQGSVAISPGMRQNLGIRVVEVERGAIKSALNVVGNVAFNERDLFVLQARASGYVEKLFVRAPLEPVRKGQALFELYVPDWVAAQEEYLAIQRMPPGAASAGLLEAARQRMQLAGMTAEQVRQVSARSQLRARMTVTAPADGIVSELTAREGMAVTLGAPLARINGLRTVWVNAEVPESAAAQVRPGMAIRATSPAFSDTRFSGKVEAVLPEVNPSTRTLKARIELANPGAKLVPGMFATIELAPANRREMLLVPSEAVIQTGTRSVVIVATGEGTFAPAEIEIGAEANGRTEVINGLKAGQKVVASGQFLIDSEASLRGSVQRLAGGAPAAPMPANMPTNVQANMPANVPTHRATGKVEQIAGNEVTLSHGPVPSLKWGPMTMGFGAPAGGLPKDIKVGDTVQFEFRAGADGSYRIVSMTRSVGGVSGVGGGGR
jgi:Cu(I)/Ag(I) efflux system membrane fusion protein